MVGIIPVYSHSNKISHYIPYIVPVNVSQKICCIYIWEPIIASICIFPNTFQLYPVIISNYLYLLFSWEPTKLHYTTVGSPSNHHSTTMFPCISQCLHYKQWSFVGSVISDLPQHIQYKMPLLPRISLLVPLPAGDTETSCRTDQEKRDRIVDAQWSIAKFEVCLLICKQIIYLFHTYINTCMYIYINQKIYIYTYMLYVCIFGIAFATHTHIYIQM